MLKKCLPFIEDVFFKISNKHSLNSQKNLWFLFRSDSSDIAKKLASCGLYFTKSQFHQNCDLKPLKSEMGEKFLPRRLNLRFLQTVTSKTRRSRRFRSLIIVVLKSFHSFSTHQTLVSENAVNKTRKFLDI